MEHVFWAKQKVINALDKRSVKLTRKLEQCSDEEAFKIEGELEELGKLKKLLKEPKVPKEVWVEALKFVGALAALGAVILYDAKGHILPKNLDRWIPGPKL